MIKKQFYMGFAGFAGFMSLKYFLTGELQWLSYIGFFAFFANFIIAKINGDKADERYIENRTRAIAFVGQIAIIELFALWGAAMLIENSNIIAALVAGCYAATLLTYAVKLYMLEEN